MARKRRASSIFKLDGQQSKSDYTYSKSLTYRERVTPDRKIGSPNMSRRSLKGANVKYVQSEEFSTSSADISTDESSHLYLRTRTILRPMDALSDTSDGEEVAEEAPPPTMRRLRSSRSRSMDVAPLANGSTVTRTLTSTSFITTKTLHRGLDVESDVDDGTESAVPLRATPLTARGGTPLGRVGASLGRAPTPLGRAPTPLGRSATPVNSYKENASLNNARGGYTLAKGAIAEDVEEEEEDTPKNKMVMWSRRTWQTITWVTTVVTTSIVMMAARAVTAGRRDTSDGMLAGGGKTSTSFSSFLSTLTLTTRRVTTSTTALLVSTRDRIRRNPVLLWLPLLFLLLLLMLVAYWWLLQSRTKTDDTATDPTDGTSFLPLVMTSAFELTRSVINGISHAAQSLALGMTSGLLVAWNSLLALGSWLLAACSTCLHTAWVSFASMFSWLGALVHTGLSYLLHLLYLTLEFLQYLALTVLGFISTSVACVYGLFLPLAANTNNESTITMQATHVETFDTQTTIHTETFDTQTTNKDTFENTQETETWSIAGWVSNAASLNWATDAYTSLSDGAIATQNWVWSGLMWLGLSVADALTTVATFTLWLLGCLWSLVCYLISGLWTLLSYIFSDIIGFFTSAATTVTSMAVATSSTIVHYSKLIFLPFFKSSEDSKIVIFPPPASDTHLVHLQRSSVDEVVSRVLSSSELKALIAAVATETSSKGQLTREDVAALVRSVVEGEVGSVKAEVTTLMAAISTETKTASEGTSRHILALRGQQEYLLQQLDMLGVGLTKLEGSVEEGQKTTEGQHTMYQEQLDALRKQIDQLTLQLHELETNHSGLAVEVKRCCKNASVTLADVERHVTTLLGDMFGETGAGGRSAEDLAAWLRTYFVAKDELEIRLTKLMAAMQASSTQEETSEAGWSMNEAAMAQTTQVVMEAVLERLRGKLQKQHTIMAKQTQDQVAQQVKLQVETAAAVLGQQVTDQLEQQLQETVASAVSVAMVQMNVSKAGGSMAMVDDGGEDGVVVLPRSSSSGTVSTTINISQNSTSSSSNGSGVGAALFASLGAGLNRSAVVEIVKEALLKYDADKTGMVDHALESAGGNIISTRCTESYQVHQAEISILGYAVYRYSTNNPRTIIQPDRMPGQCWAFKGSQGYIVVQLAGPVKPSGFTLEHIPKSLSPTGEIDSAPKDFEVWGLQSENDEGTHFGTYTYSQHGEPLQYFNVKKSSEDFFPLIELKINSNHGNLQYTCLYRFRVHGERYF